MENMNIVHTNTIELVISYDNHWRSDNVTASASALSNYSNYQLWLSVNKAPKTYAIKLENKVSSAIGNGFHKLAEEALAKEPNILLEYKMSAKIPNTDFIVSGSADVIRTGDLVIIEDFKTKGVYQAKKALAGDIEDVAIQLSIYRYLYWLENPNEKYSDYGLMNLIVTGDTGYYSKADGGGKVEKFKQIPIKLWSFERIEKFIKYRLENATSKEEPFNDCDSWRCHYCEFQCPYRKE